MLFPHQSLRDSFPQGKPYDGGRYTKPSPGGRWRRRRRMRDKATAEVGSRQSFPSSVICACGLLTASPREAQQLPSGSGALIDMRLAAFDIPAGGRGERSFAKTTKQRQSAIDTGCRFLYEHICTPPRARFSLAGRSVRPGGAKRSSGKRRGRPLRFSSTLSSRLSLI